MFEGKISDEKYPTVETSSVPTNNPYVRMILERAQSSGEFIGDTEDTRELTTLMSGLLDNSAVDRSANEKLNPISEILSILKGSPVLQRPRVKSSDFGKRIKIRGQVLKSNTFPKDVDKVPERVSNPIYRNFEKKRSSRILKDMALQ